MIPEREHAVFRLTVEAHDIEPGKIAVRDLARLSELVQRGLERTARVLFGQPSSAPGRRREITERFAETTEWFSTLGGNPVACAAALAVLE